MQRPQPKSIRENLLLSNEISSKSSNISAYELSRACNLSTFGSKICESSNAAISTLDYEKGAGVRNDVAT